MEPDVHLARRHSAQAELVQFQKAFARMRNDLKQAYECLEQHGKTCEECREFAKHLRTTWELEDDYD
jgi:hypothetical protein